MHMLMQFRKSWRREKIIAHLTYSWVRFFLCPDVLDVTFGITLGWY